MSASETRASILGPFENMTLQQKMDFMTGLAYFIALPSMVFMRRRMGVRRTKPVYLLVMAVILMTIGMCGPSVPVLLPGGIPGVPKSVYEGYPMNASPYQATRDGIGQKQFARPQAVIPMTPFPVTAIGLFGVAAFLVGVIQNKVGWWTLRKGIRWHSYSTGMSWFRFLPVSEFIVHRYVDPIICFFIGMYVTRSAPLLGGWLMFSAVMLAAFEQVMFDKQIARDLDMLDGLVNAEVQRESAEFYLSGGKSSGAKEASGKVQPRRTLQKTAGIATGIAPDIERQVAQRMREYEDRSVSDSAATARRVAISAAVQTLAAAGVAGVPDNLA